METQQQQVGDVSVFRVSGIYTHRDAGGLLSEVKQAVQHGFGKIVLDLSGVAHFGAAGLGELIKIQNAVGIVGGQLVLASVPGRIRYLMVAANLEPLFTLSDSEDRAIISLTRQVVLGAA